MPTCTTCGEPATGPSGYSCNYCTGNHCSDHRLPENHHCPGVSGARSLGPDFRAVEEPAEPVRIGDPVGPTPGDGGARSPSGGGLVDWGVAAHFGRRAVIIGVAAGIAAGAVRYWEAISSAVPSELPDTGSTGGRFDGAAVEQRIHELVNEERGARGLATLAWRDDLQAVAAGHSRDMSERGYFAHESPDGRDSSDRLAAAGIACGGSGENIARSWWRRDVNTPDGTERYDTVDELAASVVEQWMNSPGHRENILHPLWRSEAVGVVAASNDEVFITQNFCG